MDNWVCQGYGLGLGYGCEHSLDMGMGGNLETLCGKCLCERGRVMTKDYHSQVQKTSKLS